ncbi:Hypothetical protein SRAE_1000031800 [Strongyloides ratti]|uniref:Uncharacterized protein n=1 Tax=Strongyloides ratti TaxID=34506 RepID=A0A090L1P2_STRRB|nr:Hypothetical protein SRAE_1000031800 [Strongyloides ratti]CEF62042.1 Hypothetical protein SRAE_1000031800 [Strongyloides ratti]
MLNHSTNSSVLDFYNSYPSIPRETDYYSVISICIIFIIFISTLIYIIATKKYSCSKENLINFVQNIEKLPTHKEKYFDLDVITIENNGKCISQKLNDFEKSSQITFCDDDLKSQLTI